MITARHSGRNGAALGLAIAFVVVMAGTALFMSGFWLGNRDQSHPGTPASDDQLFEPFWNAYETIVNRYAGGEVDKAKVIQGAIKGMIEALGDPYSSYLSPEDFQKSLQEISGQFEGIGAEIGTVDAAGQASDCATLGPACRLVIIAPIEGSPAATVGLRPGDVIAAVDGSAVDGQTVDDARGRIRGDKGTQVKLTIQRQGQAGFDVTITRDVIQQKEVIAKDLANGQVGYIRLTGFSTAGAKGVHTELAADVAAGRKKIILDLRGNPGGFVEAARDVASEFIADGTLFWQQDADGTKTPTAATGSGAATDPGIEVVVLVDRGSASASEIVAAALQDRHRATLVGETTFGKGTVQEWTPLDGAGGFRLTIAKWLTPDQRWIHKVGVKPDVEVTVPADVAAGEDPVLDRALQVLSVQASLERAA
ncbi:MAG: S41 family peptidase [Chloroflexota bacterium]|nr:S41 family peptidase [Chloroflexota bacterium]